MKNLLRLSAVLLTVGMLGATACSSCMPPAEETSKPQEYKQSYTCGAGTHRVGNQCVGDTSSAASPRAVAKPISPTGNN